MPSGRNQVRYNDKISAVRREIQQEKRDYIQKCENDIKRLLERRSPTDTGRLKSEWGVEIEGKHKLAGRTLSAISQVREIHLRLVISSNARHAPMQMFGWHQSGHQLLTGRKRGGKWEIVKASKPNPIFSAIAEKKKKRKKPNPFKYHSFVTTEKDLPPNKDLAWSGGSHSIRSEISRIFKRNADSLKYIKFSGGFDLKEAITTNYVVSRIKKWMLGKVDKKTLDSKATKRFNQQTRSWEEMG